MPNDNAPALRSMSMAEAGFNSDAGFALLQRGAKLLASSTLVPDTYRDNLANCVIALNMAQRMSADPLMVMQNLYMVHGRPAWSAQFLIACFNQCGRFSAIRYRWQGTEGKDDRGCRAYATERESKQEIVGPLITIATAKEEGWFNKSGSKWKTIPELMTTYRAAAWMIRTHAPELAMGLPTDDEVRDIIDITPSAGDEPTPAGAISAAKEAIRAAMPPIDVATGEVLEHAKLQRTTPQQEALRQYAQGLPGDNAAKVSNVAGTSPAAVAPDLMPPPRLSDVLVAIDKAKDHDELDLVLDAARGLPEPMAAAEIDVAARAKRKALGAR